MVKHVQYSISYHIDLYIPVYIYIYIYVWEFPEMGVPKMDGLHWNIPLKWMIWGYLHFRKSPYIYIFTYIYIYIAIYYPYIKLYNHIYPVAVNPHEIPMKLHTTLDVSTFAEAPRFRPSCRNKTSLQKALGSWSKV